MVNYLVMFLHGLVVLGAAALFFLTGCGPTAAKSGSIRLDPAGFNAARALEDIRALVAVTPRHSGSPGARRAAELILSRLKAAGLDAEIDEFGEDTPAGRFLFRNVIGRLPGRLPGGGPAEKWIILGAHYDTKAGIADDFQGANDSGSGVGVLLELARNIKAGPALPVNCIFAFFDGEECVNRYGKNDGLHGSRRLAEQFRRDRRALKTRAVIILDMVGDADLNITIPGNCALGVVSAVFKAAEAGGVRHKFSLCTAHMLDDHAPFLAAGMPAVDIIDFEYGSRPGLNDYWHTPADTLDKLSAESLSTVGRTVLRALDDLAGRE